MLAIVPDTVLVGPTANPIHGAAVVVHQDIIAGVTRRLPSESDVERIDLPGTTLLPGLVDCHVHLSGRRSTVISNDDLVPIEVRAARAAADADRIVRSGVTTVRDCGGSVAPLLKGGGLGSLLLPGMVTASRFVEPTGGADEPRYTPGAAGCSALSCPTRTADGPVDIRRAVREQIRAGADIIKTATDGLLTGSADTPSLSLEWTDDELSSLIDEAHRHGRAVAVHAHTTAAIRQALLAGADTIEHGTYLDPPCAELLADRGAVLIPTLMGTIERARRGAAMGAPEWLVKRSQRALEQHSAAVQNAMQAGAKIAVGSDSSGQPLLPHGTTANEIAALVEVGMDPRLAIAAATLGGASALGMDRLGLVAAGYQADLIAVRGDPATVVGVLSDPAMVMQDGRVTVLRM